MSLVEFLACVLGPGHTWRRLYRYDWDAGRRRLLGWRCASCRCFRYDLPIETRRRSDFVLNPAPSTTPKDPS